MLVFGGCNAAGVFFNDAYVLNLDRMHWSRAQPLNTPPPPRYHHCCHLLGSRVAMYGGINPKQAFDAVVLLETNFGGELSAVAEELARMTGGSATTAAAATAASSMLGMNRAAAASAASSPAASLAAAAGAVGGSVPLVGDLMKLQLRDLLVKRNMEELHITAQQKVSTEGPGWGRASHVGLDAGIQACRHAPHVDGLCSSLCAAAACRNVARLQPCAAAAPHQLHHQPHFNAVPIAAGLTCCAAARAAAAPAAAPAAPRLRLLR
jgi:hypothetical protein